MGYLEGFGVTIKKWMTPGSDSGRRVTLQYPEQTRPKPERFHGRHVLNRYADGMEKCIGCELCAGVCPAKCIYVRGADNDPDDPTSPGERFGFIYEINYLRCIHCDLCVEACPTQAITESKLFEFAFTNRADAIYTKAELVVDDEGRPQQLPWENWDGGYDPAELSSGWMRATSPGGDADFVGIVAWASELGYGVRAPEGGGRVDGDQPTELAAAPDSDADGHDDHGHDADGHDADGHDDHGHDDHGHDAGDDHDDVEVDQGHFDHDSGPVDLAESGDDLTEPSEDPSQDSSDGVAGEQEPTLSSAGEFDAGSADQADESAGTAEADPETVTAPRPAGLFDAGDADVLDDSAPAQSAAPSPTPAPEADPEPLPVAPEEPVQVPAPEEPPTEEPPTEEPDAPTAGEPDATPTRPMGSGFFDLPDEPEPEPKDNGKRRRGWGRR